MNRPIPGRLAPYCAVVCLAWPIAVRAQSDEPGNAGPRSPVVESAAPAAILPPARLLPGLATPTTDSGFWAPLRAVPADFGRFFSAHTTKIVGIGGLAALAAHPWDGFAITGPPEPLRPDLFTAGNIAGGFAVQAGASIGLYSIARLTGADGLTAVGADLIRAQTLAQGVVQAGKFATRRSRPDASNRYSLPSGHTAAAFTTAAVLHTHYGWKIGGPAYGFGAYVAASRMSANKHHLSDVVLGAAIGIAAGRTVAIGSGAARFDVGLTATAGDHVHQALTCRETQLVDSLPAADPTPSERSSAPAAGLYVLLG